MHWLDIVLAVYLILGAIYGFRRGLVWVGFSLLGYLAGVLLADHEASSVTRLMTSALPLRQWVDRYLPSPAAHIAGVRVEAWQLTSRVLELVVFLIIIGLLELLGRTLGAAMSRRLRSIPIASILNTAGGLAAGLAENALVAGLVLTLILAVPAVSQSSLGHTVQRAPVAKVLIQMFAHLAKIPGSQYL